MTAKRRKAPTDSELRRRRRTVDPSPSAGTPPPPTAHPPQPQVQNSFFERKCKLGTLLQRRFVDYKNLLRQVAEELSVLRNNAMNFALFMVIQWFTTQQLEIRAYQRQQLPNFQIYLQRLLHETSLINQLQQLIQQTGINHSLSFWKRCLDYEKGL
ncbi:hypothetical protein MFLAVUS_005414 [Mucor flavus]|uniref:Uncharacterized protein n=1 Tax=Mucor flavus TaxID=439312 RepID=A0ABP9YYQ3_9FUNG